MAKNYRVELAKKNYSKVVKVVIIKANSEYEARTKAEKENSGYWAVEIEEE